MSNKTEALRVYLEVCPKTEEFYDSPHYAKIRQFFINWLNTLPRNVSWNQMMLLGTGSMREGLPDLTDREKEMITMWVDQPTYTAWCKLVMIQRMGA